MDEGYNISYLSNEHKEKENNESMTGYGEEEIFLLRLSRNVVFSAFCRIENTHCDKPSANAVQVQ